MRLLFTFIMVLLNVGLIKSQCSVVELSLDNRKNNSDLIVEGKVISKKSFWNTERKMIYTSNTIEVYKVFKGNLINTNIEVLSMGGIVGMDKIVVEPSLELEIGEIGILMCESVKRYRALPSKKSVIPTFEVYGAMQGFIKYDVSTKKAYDSFNSYEINPKLYESILGAGMQQWIEMKAFNINELTQVSIEKAAISPEVQSITGFSPSVITSGTKSVLTITGSGFGSTRGTGTVGFKNADNGGTSYIIPQETQYVSWSDNQIVVEVPTKAGTGNVIVTPQGASTFTSVSTLTVSYAHLNVTYSIGSVPYVFGTQHVSDNGSGGYTWRMSTGFDSDAAAKASFMRAFDTWRCNTGVNWIIGATTTTNVAEDDGQNVICFDNTSPLSAGVLGTCYSYFSGCFTGATTMTWYIKELDIIFDEGSNITPRTWEYGTALPTTSEYDFETVAVHELGHGHQLGHVISPGAIMHYAISNGSSNRSLSANDLAGGNYVQNKSTTQAVCSQGLMTNHNCGSVPVASFSASSRTVCAGVVVNFSDLSTNTPTAWSWTLTGATPSVSTSQNPSITYNTAGTYPVTLLASNSNGADTETQTGYITVNALPNVSISSSNTVCIGSSIVLTASGATSYTWNTGSNTTSISVSPSSNTTYSVVGRNSNGCSKSASKIISAISCGITSTVSPTFSGGVCGSTLSSIDQTIYWTGVTGATNYRVRIISTTSTFSTVNTRNQGSTTNFKLSWVPGIQYGQSYDMSISAYVNGVWQSYGPTCNVSTTPLNSAPTSSLSPGSCGKSLTSLDELLYFTGVPMATNYRLEISNAAQSFTTVNVRNNTVLNYRMSWITGVQYGRTYNVRISAMINGAWQAYGNMCTVTTPSAIPTTQFAICGNTVPSLTTTVNFNPVVGATKYRLEITPSVGTPTVHVRPNNLTTWALSYQTGTKCGVTYSIRVSAYVGNVWGAYGPPCTLSCSGTQLRILNENGEMNNEEDLQVKLYPNPNNGRFTLDLPEDADVIIMDALGKEVLRHHFNAGKQELELNNVENGIYFIDICGKFGKLNRKVIINK